MCVVSMVGDHYNDKWFPKFPDFHEVEPTVTKSEFDALKKEVEEMKKLLERAVEYDKRTGQPECEMEDKVALLKAVAKAVGVDLSDIFKE